jgi:hypothetical protein
MFACQYANLYKIFLSQKRRYSLHFQAIFHFGLFEIPLCFHSMFRTRTSINYILAWLLKRIFVFVIYMDQPNNHILHKRQCICQSTWGIHMLLKVLSL